jgi:hypothetical protein
MLHQHDHPDRAPSTEPHSHAHPLLPGEALLHDHAHRHVYDLAVFDLEGAGRGKHHCGICGADFPTAEALHEHLAEGHLPR